MVVNVKAVVKFQTKLFVDIGWTCVKTSNVGKIMTIHPDLFGLYHLLMVIWGDGLLLVLLFLPTLIIIRA